MKKPVAVAALVLTLAVAIGCSAGGSTASSGAGAPTGLSATPGNGQVTLSWNPVAGVAAYNIYYATASGVNPSSGNKIGAGSATSYTLTGLVNGVTYYYVVTAVTSSGESAPSAQVSAKPVPALPPAPTGFTASASNGQVALNWSAAPGATSYNVYYATSSSVSTANGTKAAGIAGTSYTQTGLTDGTTYYFIVTAVNMAGESQASIPVSATPFASIPATPTGVTASPGNGQVTLSWNPSPSATTYNVYYGTSASVGPGSGTKAGGLTGTSCTLANLTNGTLYYFAVTAQNSIGESTPSSPISATPTSGITIAITPGQTSTGTLQAAANTSLAFSFPASAVTQNTVATITSLSESALPVPLTANDSFVASFQLELTPSLAALNAPVQLAGSVNGSAVAAGTTLKLATVQNNAWVDVATLVVGANGSLAENLASFSLPGLLAPGAYLLYQPVADSNTSVSNFGVALLADDGYSMADGSLGVQIVYLYDANGNLLATPQLSYLNSPNGSEKLDAVALSPDGSQGIVLDALSNVDFFSALQTGTPVIAPYDVAVSSYGSSPEAVAMLPNGDEAVVSAGSPNLVLFSGILSGSPVAATLINAPATRDGLVLSSDGSVLLARGSSGLTVFSVTQLGEPVAGSIGGTVSHSFTEQADYAWLGSNGEFEPGREGMAISPVDSSRAVIVNPSGSIQMLTGLPMSGLVDPAIPLPAGFIPNAVTISPNGKLAIVGGSSGLLLYSGVDTGNLVLVEGPYAPSYSASNPNNSPASTYFMGQVTTLGVTLDGKYILAGDRQNEALVVVPFSASGFGSVASALAEIAVPDNDQLLSH